MRCATNTYVVRFFSCVGCSEMEEKIDLVSKMTDELTRQQQEREDMALQQKRYFQIE